MTIRLNNGTRDASLDAIDTAVNTGTGTTGGTIEIFTGVVNGTFGSNPAGTLISTITLDATAFAASSSGVMVATLTSPDGTAAPSALVAGCFVISDRDGAHVLDGSITVTSGGGDLELTDVNIGNGVVISIPTVTLTAGNAP